MIDLASRNWDSKLVKQATIVATELLIAFPLGFLLTSLGINGLAWILSGIAAGAIALGITHRIVDRTVQPNPTARKVGLALVGFTIGCSVTYAQLNQMSAQLPVFVFLTLLMLLSGTAIGYLYSRTSQTNLLTAMLATVPGGIGVMASIAADYGKNVTQVALVQVLRVTAVILLIPFVARILAGYPASAEAILREPLIQIDLPYLGLVCLSLIAIVGCITLAKRLRIPAAFFFGAVVAGISFNPLLHTLPALSAVDFSPPPLLGMLGNILLGITIGEYWGSGFTLRKPAITHAILPVVLTILAGLLAATIAMLLTSWDWLTCLLVTAPGGAPEMILAALALHHNVETVTTGHLVRLMAINASLPLWVWLFRTLDRHPVQVEKDSTSAVFSSLLFGKIKHEQQKTVL
jgi:membrane AbrB-like protein